MGRPWKRRVTFNEDGSLVLLKRLSRIGNGFALFVPKEFIVFHCSPDEEGEYWIKLSLDHENEKILIEGWRWNK